MSLVQLPYMKFNQNIVFLQSIHLSRIDQSPAAPVFPFQLFPFRLCNRWFSQITFNQDIQEHKNPAFVNARMLVGSKTAEHFIQKHWHWSEDNKDPMVDKKY